MSSAQERVTKHRFSVQDYHRLGYSGILHEDDRVELIEGELIDMSPIGSQHASIVKQLNTALVKAVQEKAIVSVQDPVRLGDYSEPQPDIALLRPDAAFYRDSHPRAQDIFLIIEVADTSIQYDREVKIPLYAHNQIPEVWIIDIEGKSVTKFCNPLEGKFSTEVALNLREKISPIQLTDVSIDLSVLFCF